jgi:hypothetical protein
METRRIRRLERRRTYRIVALAMSMAVMCVAIGMALPGSTTTSLVLFALAVCCLGVLAARDDSIAPLHGLHDVVRLPFGTALSASLESFRSRVAGSLRALARYRPRPTPIVLDEADEEAAAWWGPSGTPTPAMKPIVAAPIATAHVPAQDSSLPTRAKQLWANVRDRIEPLATKRKRADREAAAST